MSPSTAIGGYFGLELTYRGEIPHAGAAAFQSARAAFLALLREVRPSRVWMPWFICDSMLEPLRMAGVPFGRYSLDESLSIDAGLVPARDEWVLYVNYFGLRDAYCRSLLERFDPSQVIIDNAQSFYSEALGAGATLYSPRKFFGVPDGGLLVTSRAVRPPQVEDTGSLARCRHLLLRTAADAEAGYAAFTEAEATFVQQEPRALSKLTRALMQSIDYARVRDRRRRNFERLHAELCATNELQIELGDSATPMCYPYRTRDLGLRARLSTSRIYVPTYWPEVVRADAGVPTSQRDLASTLVPLPCDQRYSVRDMETILEVVSAGRHS